MGNWTPWTTAVGADSGLRILWHRETRHIAGQYICCRQNNEFWHDVWRRFHQRSRSNDVSRFRVFESVTTLFPTFFHICSQLRHSNIVQLYGVCSRSRPIYIVAEYMKHGSLSSYLNKNRSSLFGNMRQLLSICKQVCGLWIIFHRNFAI